MNLLEVILFLMLCAVALGWVARRAELPYSIALIVGGGALGFVPQLPQVTFDPQSLLVIVLPPILYQGALLASWRDFKENVRPISLLSVGLVIATTVVVGATLKWLIPDIPWAAAFALGAIVSPTDAVATSAILSQSSMPRRLVAVLQGESLVNDASGLVTYKFAVAAVLTGAFSLLDASLDFVFVSVGGILVGVVMARLFVFIHRHLGDTFIEVLMTLAVPYLAYLFAESLKVSGVLAVLSAGIVRGRYSPEIVSAEMRIIARSVWNMLVFLLNSLVFVLIGMQLSGIIERLSGYSLVTLFSYGVLVSMVAILVRFAWIYPSSWLSQCVARSPRLAAALRPGARQPESELFVMSWCGMRGIVSLCAALALPVALPDGTPFPYRDLIIFLTFFLISVTLVVQGLTLAPLTRKLRVGADSSIQEEKRLAKLALARAAMAAIDSVAGRERIPHDVAERIRAEFAEKIRLEMPGDSRPIGSDPARLLRSAAIQAERRELIRIWRDDQISDEVLHELEEGLDYQESHL